MLMDVLARNWWAFVFRGVAAVLFGVVALALPGVTMLSLVLVFAVYAIVDGIFAIIAAVHAAQAHEKWGYLTLEGLVGILAGIVAVAWPGLTVVLFVTLVAVWALLTGGLLLAAGFKVDADHGRWWMILGAAASILFGASLLIAPLLGGLVLTSWIGAYALVFGGAMLVLAFRLRSRFNHLRSSLLPGAGHHA
jgi:uncharacterized membrane protein HdeD (DUF308 family)